MRERKVASVISSWVRVLIDALRGHGLDPTPVLVAAGFEPSSFRDPNARHPVTAVARLWKIGAEAMNDPAFGLVVPKFSRPTTFHALGYAMMASGTLGEALDRAVLYCQLVADAGFLEVHVREDTHEASLRIMAHPGYEQTGGAAFRDSVLAVFYRACRALTARTFVLERVTLGRRGTPDAPPDLAPYERFFRCPVTLDAYDTLVFDTSLLAMPLGSANPELARSNDAVAREYLARTAGGDLVDRMRFFLAESLPTGVTPEAIARQVGTSLRSLQRSLKERGTSYEDVLRELRLELARGYLREGRHSQTEIAFLLGYESASAFARAYRRWTGSTLASDGAMAPPRAREGRGI